MDSWEDEEFEPPLPVVAKEADVPSKWDDEDLEGEEPKPIWDNEPAKTEPSTKKDTKIKPKKTIAKKGAKASTVTKVEDNEDPMTKRLKDQLRVEESDFQNTQDVFSGLDSVSVISTSDPKDEKDFEALAETLARKLSVYEKSYHFKGFLKSFLKHTTQSLKTEEVKELAAVLTVISNEKLKSEKTGKKKKAAPKKTLNVKEDDNQGPDDYDDYSDFM